MQKEFIESLDVRHIFSISEMAENIEDAMLNGANYLEKMASSLKKSVIKMNSIFDKTEQELIKVGFEFERKDFNRPWGGFWVIEEAQTEKFAKKYFPNIAIADLTKGLKVSPKILLVAPNKRLSWQYHFRRSEIWKVVQGTIGVVKSDTDEETPLKKYSVGDIIILKKGERHRLIGLDHWG